MTVTLKAWGGDSAEKGCVPWVSTQPHCWALRCSGGVTGRRQSDHRGLILTPLCQPQAGRGLHPRVPFSLGKGAEQAPGGHRAGGPLWGSRKVKGGKAQRRVGGRASVTVPESGLQMAALLAGGSTAGLEGPHPRARLPRDDGEGQPAPPPNPPGPWGRAAIHGLRSGLGGHGVSSAEGRFSGSPYT